MPSLTITLQLPKMQPLPKQLNESNTVCSYCGVSYLVMHEIEKLKQEITDLKKKNALLERKQTVSQLGEHQQNNQVKAVADMNAALNSTVAELKVEMSELRTKCHQFEQIIIKQKIQFKDVEILSIKQQDETEIIKTQLNKIRTSVQNNNFLEIFDNLSNNITQQTLKCSFQNNLLQANKQQLLDDQRQINQLEEQLNQFKLQLDEKQLLLNEQCRVITELQQNIKNTDETSNEHINQLNKQIQSQLSQISSLQQQSQQQADTISQLNNQTAIQNDKITEFENKTIQLESQLQNKINEISQLQQQILNLQQQVENNNNQQLMQWQLQYNQIVSENLELQKQIKQYNEQIDQLANKNNVLAQENNQLQQQLQQSKNSNLFLEQENSKFKKQMGNENESIETMMKEVQFLKEQLSISQKAEKNYLDEVMKLKNAQGDFNAQQDQLTSKLTQQYGIISNLKQEILKCEKNLVKSDQKNQELLVANAQLKEQLTKLEQQLQSKDTNQQAKQQYEYQIKQLNDKVQVLQKTVFNECKERNELMRLLNQLREGQSPTRK